MTWQEEILCGVLGDLFGIPEGMSPQDSFVRLGGDSIIAVQLVGAARRAGLVVAVRDVLTQPDIAALAATARPVARRAAANTDDGVGAVTPTPIMHWLRERGGPADRYYQFMVVRTPVGLSLEAARAVLQAVLDRHDMLRFRTSDGVPQTAPAGSVSAEDCLIRVAAAGTVSAGQVEREVNAARDRLSTAEGLVVQAVWFDAGPELPGYLALVINHTVVDGISWRVLTGDLARAWAAVSAGRTPDLELVPTTFRAWSKLLDAEAASAERAAELPYWTEVVRPGAVGIGRRALDPARDHEDVAEHLVLELPVATTSPLLTTAAETLGANVNEMLLTGLALALAGWRACGASVLVDMEGHGREEIVAETDLSRTVGWFTTIFPTRFELDQLDASDAPYGGPTVGVALHRVKEQLRAIPGKGLGYGLLRYLRSDTRQALAAADNPDIGFNYLGRFDATDAAEWQMSPEFGARLDAPGPGMPMAHAIEVNAVVLDLADGPVLRADWAWAEGVLDECELRALAESWFRMLTALVTHADRPSAGGALAADMTVALIDQDELDDLAATLDLF